MTIKKIKIKRNIIYIPCSIRLCSASFSDVSKLISHCSHLKDLSAEELAGPGRVDDK